MDSEPYQFDVQGTVKNHTKRASQGRSSLRTYMIADEEGRLRLQKSLPARIWAVLLRRRETYFRVEAVAAGVGWLEKWGGFNGGYPRSFVVRRLVWVRQGGGRWRGKWVWEEYDREEEWDMSSWFRSVNRRWRNMSWSMAGPTLAPLPREALIRMSQLLDWVRAYMSFTEQDQFILIAGS